MPANNMPLNMALIKADMIAAGSCITEAKKMSAKASKYIKGLAAFHLQQAFEKLIKIQLYHSGKKLDLKRLYKHSLYDLIVYAGDLNVNITVPYYILKNQVVITSWEAGGRYDVHKVVRIDTLEKCYQVINEWYDYIKRSGIR